MRRLVLLAAAQRDLIQIVDFITEASGHADIGERVAAELTAQCDRLARLPGTLGRPGSELAAGLRSFAFRDHLISFVDGDQALFFINILHSSRDIDAFFTEGP